MLDRSTGLYFVRARTYDSRVGRFMSRDPVAGVTSVPESQHPYVFVYNNPFVLCDPSGGFSLTETQITLVIQGIQAAMAVNALYSVFKFIRGFKEGWNITKNGDPLEQVLTSVVALGDGATLGIAGVIRELLFADDGIDEKSLAYTGVEVIGSLATLKGLAVGLNGTLREMSRRVVDDVLDTDLKLGRDLFKRARALLASNKTLSAGTKADVFEQVAGKIHEMDPSWVANRGSATNAAAVFTGEGRPFGFAIDQAGKVWQIENVTQGGTFGPGGTFTIDFSAWTLIE